MKRKRDDEQERGTFERWTREPTKGAVLPLVALGLSVVRLDSAKKKRSEQIAALFAGAPDDVRDAGVAFMERDDGDYSDVAARIVLSTDRVDSYNSTIDPNGWELADFRKNPVVLFAHNSWELPVGRDAGAFIDKEKRALVGVTRFVSEKMGADEAKVGKWVAAGALNAASVGFEPLEWEVNEERDDGESWFYPVDFLRQALREYSIVPVPANPDCLVDGRSLAARGVDPREFRAMLEEALDSADAFYIPRRDLLALKRAQDGDAVVVDMGALGTFSVTRGDASVRHQHRADLTCPECGHTGPAAEFGGGDEGAEDDGEGEPADAAEEMSGATVDSASEPRHADAQETRNADALVDLAGQVADLVASGRLP